MSTQPYRNVAYGLSEPLLNVAQAPIISQRDPTTKDRAQLGTEWINQLTDNVFILVKVEDNVSTWVSIGAGTSATTFDADSGTAMPAGGIINLLGAGDLTTSAAGSTVTFTSTGADIFDADSGTATASSNTIIIAGGTGITTTASGSTITINASASTPLTFDGNSGSATPAANTITIEGGNNITTSGAAAILTVNVSGTTNHTLQVGNASGSLTSLAAANNGQIPIGSTGADPVVATITAGSGITVTNGAGTITIASSGGGGITTIDGNSSFVTGSTVTISVPTNNGTPVFTGNGTTTMSLTFDDINSNLGLGLGSVKAGSGNIGIGGSAGGLCNSSSQGNCLLGSSAGAGIVSGNNNCMIGLGSGFPIGSGSFNLLFGLTSGSSLGIADSSNIYFNTTGPGTESNVLRIGQATGSSDQDLANAYICGIQGVNVGSVASVVAISGDQLGTATITAGSGISVTPTANTITIAATGGGSGIVTIDGNSGSITGSTVTIEVGNVNGNAVFTNSGTTSSLIFTDVNGNTTIGGGTPSTGGGNDNTCLGENAGNLLAGALGNTFIGNGAGAGSGTSISGDANNAFGSGALPHVTSGDHNCDFGGTLRVTTGSQNVSIGGNGGINYTSSENDNIVINSSGSGGESNTLRIGAATGTANYQLNEAHICGIQGITVTGTAVLVSATDQLGIAVSSQRFKNDIQPMNDASDAIYKLRPVTFTWNRNSAPGLKDAPEARQCGLIAEEVAPLLPQIVGFDKSGSPLNINYGDLTSLLVNEIQKLQARIAALESK